MPLNRNKPFGVISGTGIRASFEQSGHDGKARYYDSQGVEVDLATGERLEEPVVEADASGAIVMDGVAWADRARELMRQAEAGEIKQFTGWALKCAALLGGDNPPSNKADIVAALQKRLDAMAGPTGAPASDPTKVTAAVKPVAKIADGPIDLGAWARGQQRYLFDDVAKVIRETYSRDVSTTPDALDLLIEEGVVNADEAMRV